MKRLLALFLAMLFAICGIASVIAADKLSKGDVNSSGDIDMMDYILVKRAYFGTFTFDDEQSECADINASGALDMMDYILLKRMYFGTYDLSGNSDDSSLVDNSEVTDDSSDISDTTDTTDAPDISDTTDTTDTPDISDTSTPEGSGDSSEPEVPVETDSAIVSIGKSYTYTNEVYTNDVGGIGRDPDVRLTDGAKEHNKYYDIQYVGFHTSYAETVSVVIDLGKVYETNKYVGYTYGGGLDGVENPSSMMIEVSTDNENWTVVGDGYAGTTNVVDDWGNNGVLASYTVASSKVFNAQYVKFSFVSEGNFVMMDELEVYKYNPSGNDSGSSDNADPDIGNDDETTVNTTGEDILLCYISEFDNEISITKDEFLPAVGYTVNGEIKDYMYDSFIFLCQPNYLYDWDSSGAAYLKPFTKADWSEYIINEEFKSDRNINALDAAVGEVKAALGDTDYKAKVYMTLFYPVETVTNFGVVDGKNLDFTNIEDRKAGIQWMVDESIRQFNARNYQNIELAGFYWFCEEIYEESGAGREIAGYVTDYIRTLDMKTTWCPYFYANGYQDWQELGFDIATMQANYFPARKGWPNAGGSERLPLVAQAVRKYGIGVGMEMADVEQTDSAEIFKEYMEAGVNYGFMTVNHIYYMSTGPDIISSLCNSTNSTFRTTYDELYKFIHGTLTVNDITW